MGIKTLMCSVALLCMCAMPAHAAVLVTEIAWMGTGVSSADEWIELYNDGNEAVDLSLYTLEWDDTVISLSGSLESQSFYLLERTDDNSQPTVVADLIYSGALGNSGERLSISNDGVEVWYIDAIDGWLAGDNSTKETMQWVGTSWVTGSPTPKSEAVGSVGDSLDEDGTTVAVTYNEPVPYVEPTYSLQLAGPAYASAGSPIVLRAIGIPTHEAFGYNWSLGDAAKSQSRRVSHTYYYPGTYAPTVRAQRGDTEYRAQAKVVVFEPEIDIVESDSSKVMVRNQSAYPVDLYKWSLQRERKSFIFPRDTVVLSGAEVSFSSRVTNMAGTTTTTYLYRPDGVEAARYSLAAETSEKDSLAQLQKMIDLASNQLAALAASKEFLGKSMEQPKVERRIVDGVVDVPTSTVSAASTSSVDVFVVPRKRQSSFLGKIGGWFDSLFGS